MRSEPAPSPGYAEVCRARLVDEYAPAIPIGVAFNVVLAWICYVAGDSRAAGTLTVIAGCFALTHPLTRSAWARRHPHVPIMGIAALCAVGAATLTLVGPLFHAAGWGILMVCWGMGATQLSLTTPSVGAGIAMQLVIFLAVRHLRGAPHGVGDSLIYGLVVCGAFLALHGSRKLHERSRGLFDEEAALRRTESDLRQREAELSARGTETEAVARKQVDELLATTQTLEALEELLSDRVRHRSRQMADEVTRESLVHEASPDRRSESLV